MLLCQFTQVQIICKASRNYGYIIHIFKSVQFLATEPASMIILSVGVTSSDAAPLEDHHKVHCVGHKWVIKAIQHFRI